MYFEKKGKENTEKTLEIAFSEAKKRNIGHIVLATTWGDTAKMAVKYKRENPQINIVAVTHNTGFKTPGVQEMPVDVREMLEKEGIRVLTGTMVTRNMGRSIKSKLGFSESDILCACWRMFGEGTKVCIEISAMACDAGLIPPENIIALAGTGQGADTAMIISAQSSNEILGMKIREYLAKPADF